ncbi:MAG: hypothetical protein JWQ69_399 [Pseudomonas sp.]|nr:hypothetical protein [Pseudomonas sp.]
MFNSPENLTKQSAELELPSVPVALDDGLLPVDTLTLPIIVHLKVWAAARPGYTYQLFWDQGQLGPEKKILATDTPGDLLTLELPVNALTDGRHQLAYRIYNPFSQLEDFSPSIPIEIDRTAPGNPLIGPMLFPASVQDGLTSTELEELGDVLEATIASYNDMKEGDVIRTYWGATEGPTVTVGKDDMGLQRVMVSFTRDFLQPLGDIEASVYYTVTDRAGNLSMNAEPAIIKLLLSVVTPLPEPQVKEAKDDGTLDPADTTAGATVVIDASANLKQGDVVTVSWQGPISSDSKEKTITSAQAGQALSVIFSGILVASNVGHTVNISYIVTRTNGTDQPSPILNLLITAGLSNLEKPLVAGVIDNVLVPESVPEYGVTVTAPRYAGIAAKDSIIVNWAGAATHTTEPQTVETPGPLDFTVPKSVALASAGGAVAVTYEVTRGNAAPVESQANGFTVQALAPPVDFGADHAIAVPGYIVAEGRPPLSPPAGAVYTRVATGGVPPYTSHSSNLACALVDDAGTVTMAGNGVSVMTATDSAGNSAQYRLTTSGALVFVLLDKTPRAMDEYVNFCVQQNVHALSRANFRQIYAAYSSESPAVGTLLDWMTGCWTYEQVKPGATGPLRNAYLFNLDNGQEAINVYYVRQGCIGIRK